jgi:hypothetical protein
MLAQSTSPHAYRTKQQSHPVWPLPSLNGREPVVVERNAKMPGIDVAYARAFPTELLAKYPIGTNGSPTHFMPSSMPAYAVGDGFIAYAGKQAHGYALLVNHNNGWATYYAGLEHMFARPTSNRSRARAERVKAGDVLGYVGNVQPGEMKALHFELWKLDEEGHFEPVGDTLRYMREWLVLPWIDERLTPTETDVAQIAA